PFIGSFVQVYSSLPSLLSRLTIQALPEGNVRLPVSGAGRNRCRRHALPQPWHPVCFAWVVGKTCRRAACRASTRRRFVFHTMDEIQRSILHAGNSCSSREEMYSWCVRAFVAC